MSIYYALQISFRLSPVQIVNFLCPIDEISVIRARQLNTKSRQIEPDRVKKLFAKHFSPYPRIEPL
jgi:hypothetical protein